MSVSRVDGSKREDEMKEGQPDSPEDPIGDSAQDSAGDETQISVAALALSAFRRRQSAGSSEGLVEFLSSHESVREHLAEMLSGVERAEAQGTDSLALFESRIADIAVQSVRDRELEIGKLCREYPEHATQLRGWLDRSVAIGDILNKPEQVGPFALMELLGQGNMGAVYLARRHGYDQLVALKILPAGRLLLPGAIELFEREAQLAVRVQHPNVCRVYEPGRHDGIPFLAMEFIEGETLEDRLSRAAEHEGAGGESLNREPIAKSEIVTWIRKIALGVHAAHEVGLIHRDLKPANIMIRSADSEPIVLDFGLAREVGVSVSQSLTRSAGTPAYSSPEQLRGRQLDPRTDVYSLGTVLYRSLTGRLPFAAVNLEKLTRLVLDAEPTPCRRLNSSISRDLAVVVATAMAKEPRARYRDALALAEDLQRIEAGVPIRARRVGVGGRLVSWSRRQPWVVATILILVVGLSSLGVVVGYAKATAGALSAVTVGRRIDETQAILDTLVPAWPHQTAALQAVLSDQIPPVLAVEDGLAELLEEARAKGVEEAGEWVFAEGIDEASYLDLLAAQEKLRRFKTVTVERLRDDIAWSQQVEALTLTRFAAAWSRAKKEILASEKYGVGQIDLAPQMGLIPLGQNPVTQLWEFYHLRSAFDPRQVSDPALLPIPSIGVDGRVDVDDQSGMVFVLLPRRSLVRDEAQAVDLLPPVFMSRFELSQRQCQALTGNNPATFQPHRLAMGSVKMSWGHPVDQLSWRDADLLMTRLGLCLPSTDEWEYACRGGATTRFYTGGTLASLLGHANLADESVVIGNGILAVEPIDDGAWMAWPVYQGEYNKFGLHNMHGNVTEWCAGMEGGEGRRYFLGGSYGDLMDDLACSARQSQPGGLADVGIGVRAMRSAVVNFSWQRVAQGYGVDEEAAPANWLYSVQSIGPGIAAVSYRGDRLQLRLEPCARRHSGMVAVFLLSPECHDPAVLDSKVTFQLSSRVDQVPFGSGNWMTPIFEQDGAVFIYGNGFIQPEPISEWHETALGERPLRYFTPLSVGLPGLGPRRAADPDNRSSAPPIRFGFAVINSTLGNRLQIIQSYRDLEWRLSPR